MNDYIILNEWKELVAGPSAYEELREAVTKIRRQDPEKDDVLVLLKGKEGNASHELIVSAVNHKKGVSLAFECCTDTTETRVYGREFEATVVWRPAATSQVRTTRFNEQ
jgi:hypothetical protein